MKKLFITSLLMLISASALSKVIRIDYTAEVDFVFSEMFPQVYGENATYQNSVFNNVSAGDIFSSYFLINLSYAPEDSNVSPNNGTYYQITTEFASSPLREPIPDPQLLTTVTEDTILIYNEKGGYNNDRLYVSDAESSRNYSNNITIDIYDDNVNIIDLITLDQSFSLDGDILDSLARNFGRNYLSDQYIENNKTFDYYDFSLTSLSYNVTSDASVSAPGTAGLLGLGILALRLRRRR